MKPQSIVWVSMAAALGLAACDGAGNDTPPPTAVETQTDEAEETASAPAQQGTALAAGAPGYASLYPEAELSRPVVMADGPSGPGGTAEFTTTASPDDVVAFYREHAQQNGLKPVMAMSQGEARAFAARNNQNDEIQVVASPDGEGTTSVQLNWTKGR